MMFRDALEAAGMLFAADAWAQEHVEYVHDDIPHILRGMENTTLSPEQREEVLKVEFVRMQKDDDDGQ